MARRPCNDARRDRAIALWRDKSPILTEHFGYAVCLCIYDVPDANSKRDVFKTGNMNGAAGLLVAFRDVHQYEATTPLPRTTKRLQQAQKDAARLVAQILGGVSDHGVVIVPGRRSKRVYVETWGAAHVIAQVAREI
jgi:hypothetical protein